MLRTHTCGELRENNAGQEVTLAGWVHSVRRSGSKMMFIDLRDRYGITQIIIEKELIEKLDFLKNLSNEYVIIVKGKVQTKPQENKKLETGKIEVLANNVELISSCKELPVSITEEVIPTEDTRLKYRYLDLRRPSMLDNFLFKHKVITAMREYLNKIGFIDVDTPMLCRSTPEGARDYIVPSRINPGLFYSLPQSPQVYKQTLMVAGFDRYYQLAKCLRDEDLRGDRQPEFTQLDVEMSFVVKEDIQKVFEEMIAHLLEKVMNINVKTPFLHISYRESMAKYNSDKPDMRKDKTDSNELAFVWVDNFPLFEYSEIEKRIVSAHHPFTQATPETWEKIDSCNTKEDYFALDSESFDLVLNGVELGSGGIRIHNTERQKKIFKIIGLTEEEAKEKFGFLLEAFEFGCPPHGGFAIGVDRLLMLLKGKETIREFIAFPKNKNAQGVMENSPNKVSERQLRDVHVKIDGK